MTARFHVHVLGVLVIIYACNAYYSKYVEISCCCCWFFVCFFPARLLSIRNVLWCSVLHAMLCCVVWCCHAKGSISVHLLVSKCLNRASHTHTHHWLAFILGATPWIYYSAKIPCEIAEFMAAPIRAEFETISLNILFVFIFFPLRFVRMGLRIVCVYIHCT